MTVPYGGILAAGSLGKPLFFVLAGATTTVGRRPGMGQQRRLQPRRTVPDGLPLVLTNTARSDDMCEFVVVPKRWGVEPRHQPPLPDDAHIGQTVP